MMASIECCQSSKPLLKHTLQAKFCHEFSQNFIRVIYKTLPKICKLITDMISK